ncbi:MAG: hypothetical protein AB1451_15545 [Nitrospirota bacterium]
MSAPPLDQAELAVLGRCVEDYCGATELLWTLQRLTPGLANRAVLVRREMTILERLLTAQLVTAYVKSSDPAVPYVPAEREIDALLVVVEREHLVNPDAPPEHTFWFAATPEGVAHYFDEQRRVGTRP